MNEAILKFAWKHRFYQAAKLFTTDGRELLVLKPGRENFDAGPDFFLADLRIGNTRWVGNVEMHVRSSDWLRHGHTADPAYNNVTLHVVYHHDTDILVQGVPLPTLELQGKISDKLLQEYDKIVAQKFKTIPCEASLRSVDKVYVSTWVNRMLVERLSQKLIQIRQLFHKNHGGIQETFYQWLCLGFGRTVNKEAFLQLARIVPLQLVRKYQNDELKLCALLLGQSGLLPSESKEEYMVKLIHEYRFLAGKHQLEAMLASNWKFLRMRPSNFPSLRIAQLSSFLSCVNWEGIYLNSLSMEYKFQVRLNEFWNTHFSFTRSTLNRQKALGVDFNHHLLINVLAPFRVFYLENSGEPWEDELEDFFQLLPPESNKVLNEMTAIGFENTCGAHSQGLLQLHNVYCEQKKCLLCSIGYQILRG